MAESIDMPFEIITGLGFDEQYVTLGDDPQGGRSNFGGTCARQA